MRHIRRNISRKNHRALAAGLAILGVAAPTFLAAQQAAAATAPTSFVAINPVRALDTRSNNTKFAANETRTVDFRSLAGVPANATAVMINVTAVGGAGTGFISLWPADVPSQGSSNVRPAPT